MDFHDPNQTQTRLIGNYIVGPRIGLGSFAEVWRSRHRQSGMEVAIKEIDKKHLSPKVGENLLKEISILSTINHPNIIRLYEAIQTKDRIYLVLEYCDGGDLAAYINRHGRVSEDVARHFMRQLAIGLKVLQDKHLIHRDLKPQNLLLATNEVTPLLKIGDFGFARSLTPQGLADTLCGSPLYMAPEIIQNQKYDGKADLWSVGAILFQLVTGKPPFDGNNQLQLFQNILTSTELHFPEGALEALNPDCVDLCRRLLRQNPVERLTYNEFFSHKFIRGEPSPTMAIREAALLGKPDTTVEQLSADPIDSRTSNFQTEKPVNSSRIFPELATSSAKNVDRFKSNIGCDNIRKSIDRDHKHSSNQPQVSDSMEAIEKEYVLVDTAHCASVETFSYYIEPSIQDCSSRVSTSSPIKNKHKKDKALRIHQKELTLDSSQRMPSASTFLWEVQGLSILHPSSKLHLLHQYIQVLSDLSQEKCNAGVFLESFSVELVVLALWKKALQICSTWVASKSESDFPGNNSAKEPDPSQKITIFPSDRGEVSVDFSSLSSVSTWAEQGFVSAFDHAEKLSHHLQESDGGAEMPDAMEIIFQKALSMGRSGAVDEYMENKGRAEMFYSQALLLLSFIVAEAMSLPLNPPFSLTPENSKRIQHYISNLQAHQTKLSSSNIIAFP